MGLTVSQWADRVLDGRKGELPNKVQIAASQPPATNEAEARLIERKPTRLKTGPLPALPPDMRG